MNAKILARVGIIVAASGASLGLFQASEPARGQDEPGVSSLAPKITVRLAETAAKSIRLRQSAGIASATHGAEGSGRALASADFDEDGVPDLVTGYAASQGGGISVQRGNVDAIYPNSADANARKQRGEFTGAAFSSNLANLPLPEAADFVGAGDFDADGHWDIVAAHRGGTKLYWLRGDGRGNFGEPQIVELAGAITALATGEINRVDGLTDIAVGIVTANGAQALVYESPNGALRGAPESFPLPGAANDFAIGSLSAAGMADLAIATANEVLVMHGRDRKLSLDAEQQAKVESARVSRAAFDSMVTSIAVGDFVGDTKKELALLTTDGMMRVLDRDLNVASTKLRVGGGAQPTHLLVTKVSTLPKNDLLVFGGATAVQVLTTSPTSTNNLTSVSQDLSVAASLTSTSEVTAILPMRLNADALQDLVMLTRDNPAPSVLETQAAATFTVNTTARTTDKTPGDGVCADAAGNCSFAAAVMEANANAGADTINFNIPGGGVPSVGTDVPSAGAVFNAVNEAVTIDGTTQPGGRVEVNANGFTPLIFFGGNSVLRGVAIYGQNTSLLLASDGNIVEGNYIGFRPDGSKPSYGQIGGINFRGGINNSRPGNNNLIGGTTAQARNIISNCDVALSLDGTTGNVIQGNWVGLTIDGTTVLPNGVSLNSNDSPVTIGGTTAGAGNVFSGATNGGTFAVGLNISRASLIQGNKIGTTADGMQPLAMRGYGVQVLTNEAVTIGGTTPAARNVIAACIWGIGVGHESGEATLIQGNYVGTNAAGTGAIPNSEAGMRLSGTRGVVVGGTAPGARNIISGNAKNGLELVGGINGTPCRNVVVQGNFIGTDVSGTSALPNGGGILLNAASDALVGGTSAEARNIISGNTGHGMEMVGLGSPNRVQGNFIGLNVFGTGALGNAKHGIYIVSNNSDNNIGGSEPGAGNRIAFNGGSGIAAERYLGGAVLSNSIFANRGLGIDNAENGVDQRSTSDFQQLPKITSVSTSANQTTISGTLTTRSDGGNSPFTIQFFSNSTPDPSGYGEGQTFVGEVNVTGAPDTNIPTIPFTATITPAVPAGRYLSAVAIGRRTVSDPTSVLTSEFSFNVRAPGDPKNNPLSISNLIPALAGNLGDATVTLYGEGIAKDATVVLRRAGISDIASQSVIVSSNGNALQATFALAGQSIGQWDIVVTNPDGTSFVLAGAFRIAQGVDADVWIDVIGRNNARPNQAQTYQILFGNRANTDAWGVPLQVSMPPGTSFKVLSETGSMTLDDIDPNHEVFDAGQDISQYDSFLDFDDARVLLLAIPVIPAGTTGSIAIQMTFPDSGEGGTLGAIIGEPILESTVAPHNAFDASNSGHASPMASPPPLFLDGRRFIREPYRTLLEGKHIKPNGEPDLRYFEKQSDDAMKAYEESPSFETQSARFRAQAQRTLATGYQGSITVAQTYKGGQALKGKIAAGPEAYVKDKVKGWFLDKAVKSLKNAGDIPDIAKDFYKTMRNLLITSKPVRKLINYIRSRDPNDKAGSAGGGNQHFITGSKPMPYGIYFENKPEASAPAQVVVITDQLDTSKLDLETLQWGPVAFGTDTIVTPPPNGLEWTADADLRPANNLIVRVSASLDKTTGSVTWRFVSIDPATNQPTTDPTAGFLPPDKVAPQGQGSVSFIIAAKPNQPDGTEIRNKARIVFDLNAPIDTPEWLNTIDHTPPVSAVLPLASTNSAARFEVKWNGTDSAAGVAYYSIYVSENGGAFTPWLVNTAATSAFFEGRPSTTYTFYSVAGDGAGNREAAPPAADASTTTLAGQLLNISTRMRVLTGDNVLIGGLIITGTDPKRVIIRAIGPSLSPAFAGTLADPKLELYQGNTLLASNDNWKDTQRTEIEATTIPPTNDLESAIVRTLAPGAYTAVMSGKDGGTGIGVVEAYDLDQAANSKLANIATRGFVDSGDNVMIGGVIAGGKGGADTRVLIRAIGPSLASAGITGALQDPTLELRNANGSLVRVNDNWQAAQQTEIEATTIPPTNAAESAIIATLTPGNYTAIVRGKDNLTGIAVVEVYNVQ